MHNATYLVTNIVTEKYFIKNKENLKPYNTPLDHYYFRYHCSPRVPPLDLVSLGQLQPPPSITASAMRRPAHHSVALAFTTSFDYYADDDSSSFADYFG